MSARQRTIAALHRDVAGEVTRPFSCGKCGARFASKKAKFAHKAQCSGSAFGAVNDTLCLPEDQYGHLARTIVTPAVKRRADAEWAAMDWRGQLPEGWTYEEGKALS